MPGRDDQPLGPPVGESVIVQSRKAQVVTNAFRDGWTIVAARIGAAPKLKFRAVVNRCLLGPECKRDRCLGHEEPVRKLADTIRKTYK